MKTENPATGAANRLRSGLGQSIRDGRFSAATADEIRAALDDLTWQVDDYQEQRDEARFDLGELEEAVRAVVADPMWRDIPVGLRDRVEALVVKP